MNIYNRRRRIANKHMDENINFKEDIPNDIEETEDYENNTPAIRTRGRKKKINTDENVGVV